MIRHDLGSYAEGDITTNSAEGFFSLVKRGLYGIYHKISKDYLPLYLNEYQFRYNHRELNNGDRTAAVIRSAEGKRLLYR